jgi:hypothetical protein
MKYYCDRRHNRRTAWHRWFAWHPVKLGPSDCRWLEAIERKGELCHGGMGDRWWRWEYRA